MDLRHLYSVHEKALLYLNAVTVGIESMDSNPAYSAVNVKHDMRFSVRVHTSYIDGVKNLETNKQLLNSILNKLNANRALATGYRIEGVHSIEPEEEFYFTLGGSLIVDVTVTITHTQE